MPSSNEPRIVHEVFQTPWGWCAAARGDRGFTDFVLPMESKDAAEAEILARHPESRRGREPFLALIEAVERYVNGWTVKFDDFDLDISSGTEFQRRVWGLVRKIRYGQVRTYHWIGLEMGRPEASRAIGAAVGANPLPLFIPCHRVIASDGRLTGFSACGGIALKARMLELEGLRLHGEGNHRRVLA